MSVAQHEQHELGGCNGGVVCKACGRSGSRDERALAAPRARAGGRASPSAAQDDVCALMSPVRNACEV